MGLFLRVLGYREKSIGWEVLRGGGNLSSFKFGLPAVRCAKTKNVKNKTYI